MALHKQNGMTKFSIKINSEDIVVDRREMEWGGRRGWNTVLRQQNRAKELSIRRFSLSGEREVTGK